MARHRSQPPWNPTGSTISPYLFFWQASEEGDVNVGMLFSNAVMYFIMLATGATLHAAGKTDIKSAADAAQALRPLAGDAATILLAVGLIGTGFLAVPILTGSAAYAVSEAFGWKAGLDEKPMHTKGFYAVIVASTLVGLLVDFVGINPIRALFWTAVINGVLAPPLLVIIMVIANNRRIMGRRINGLTTNLLGWSTAIVMFAAAIALMITWTRS